MALEAILKRLGQNEGFNEAKTTDRRSSFGQSSVDLPGQARQCQHFSMRVYVAENRRKNLLDISWPFNLPDENEGLLDVLPPMEIPKYRHWACQRCTQRSHPSAYAEDLPSLVLETIFLEMKDDASECENGGAVDNHTRELALVTVPESGQELEMICFERIVAENEVDNRQVADSDKRETAQGVMSDNGQDLETISLGRKNAGIELENHPVVHRDQIETAPVSMSGSDQDSVSLQKRNFLLRQPSEDQVSDDPKQSSISRKTPRFRLVSELTKVNKTGAASTAASQAIATNNHDSLALKDQLRPLKGRQKVSKKRKALNDEPHIYMAKKSSKSLGKSRFYLRDREENNVGYSNVLYSNNENPFPENGENGKHLKVSDNNINNEKGLNETEIEEVEVAKRQKRGPKSKRGHLENHIMSAKSRNTYPIPVEASPTKPQDLSVCSQSNDVEADTIGKSEAEVVAFLAKSQQERLSGETSNADQVNLVAPKRIRSGIVSPVSAENTKKIQKTLKCKSLNRKQIVSPSLELHGQNHIHQEFQKEDILREGREIILGQTSSGKYEKTGNSKKQKVYSSNNMPATELLQLISGMCPRVPSPVVQTLENSATLRNEESEKLASETLTEKEKAKVSHSSTGNHVPISGKSVALKLGSLSSEIFPENMALGKAKLGKKGKDKISDHSIPEKPDPVSAKSAPSKVGSSSSKPCQSNGTKVRRVGGKNSVQCTNVIPRIQTCIENKDPTDFTVLGPRTRFMTGHKELKQETTEAPKRGIPRKIAKEAPKQHGNCCK